MKKLTIATKNSEQIICFVCKDSLPIITSYSLLDFLIAENIAAEYSIRSGNTFQQSDVPESLLQLQCIRVFSETVKL